MLFYTHIIVYQKALIPTLLTVFQLQNNLLQFKDYTQIKKRWFSDTKLQFRLTLQNAMSNLINWPKILELSAILLLVLPN